MIDEKILQTTWFGVFIVRNGKVIDKRLFPKDPVLLAELKLRRDNGEILQEERELAQDVFVTSKRLVELGELKEDIEVEILPEDHSYDSGLLHEMLQALGPLKLKQKGEGEHLAKAVNTVQDLNETINLLTERLRDWYTVHFPELVQRHRDEDIVDAIHKYRDREEIMENMGLKKESLGKEISPVQLDFYKKLSSLIVQQRNFREELTGYIEKTMERDAPSVCHLTGAKLGAELIAQAGSLKKLAFMPASTIQLLGAEKSLFRHIKKGTPPPKHGYILQHPYVHGVNKTDRGKAARLLANHIALAARIDYFGGEPAGERLKLELNEKIERLKK